MWSEFQTTLSKTKDSGGILQRNERRASNRQIGYRPPPADKPLMLPPTPYRAGNPVDPGGGNDVPIGIRQLSLTYEYAFRTLLPKAVNCFFAAVPVACVLIAVVIQQSAEGRITGAVLTGLDVARKMVLDARICGYGDRKVIPPGQAAKREIP